MIMIKIKIKLTVTYRLKFIDSYRFMQGPLSNLVDNLSEINNKESKNKFTDSMRYMMTSLSQSINKISEIYRKISQIYKKEPDNKFIDNMKSMINSLSQSIDKVSEIDNKISQALLIEKFPNTYQLCNINLNKFALLLRKGVYPYEYIDSWKRFKEESLPDDKSLYSELNNENITDEDYAHAQKVWSTFNIKNLGEYHDLYVQSDTALLANIFENVRDKCIEIYRLDPAHFLSALGQAWQACSKKTEVELELLTDNDMLMMFEEGTRGGMCQATYRYTKANNKYVKNYDKNKESSYLEYLDANNLYGWAMSQKLPVDNFKWVDDLSVFTEDFIKNYDEDSDKGYILEVDVEYSKNIRMLHSDLPFLSERMKINNCTKLVCNLIDKERYPVPMRALKQALNHGLKLTKVHRVTEFRQEAWLKPYIDMNTELRKNAKNDSEKNFFKLMNNSVFGKTMENVRNHRDIRVVTTDKRRIILASELNYHSAKYISKDKFQTNII